MSKRGSPTQIKKIQSVIHFYNNQMTSPIESSIKKIGKFRKVLQQINPFYKVLTFNEICIILRIQFHNIIKYYQHENFLALLISTNHLASVLDI